MKEFFEQYGGVVITATAIIAIVAIIGLLAVANAERSHLQRVPGPDRFLCIKDSPVQAAGGIWRYNARKSDVWAVNGPGKEESWQMAAGAAAAS